jgi:hypothetical protein
MALQKIAIADASAKQLADFAENVLGLDGVDYRLGKGKIEEKMRTALYDKDHIEVEEEQAQIQRIEPPSSENKRRMATIFIHESDRPGGTEPVPVAVNGRQMFIPRGQQCTIPWEYYHALDNAKHYVYQQGPNGELLSESRKEVHEYPFSVMHQDPPMVVEKAA